MFRAVSNKDSPARSCLLLEQGLWVPGHAVCDGATCGQGPGINQHVALRR